MEKLQCFELWQTEQYNSSRYSMEFARKIAKEIDKDIINYIDAGSYGSAYRIDGYKVMKVTTDISEAMTAYSLIGENTNNIVKYFDVYELVDSTLKKPTYVIIMEYLITLLEYSDAVKIFFDYFAANHIKIDFFRDNIFSQKTIDNFKNLYFVEVGSHITEKEVDNNINKLKNVAIEVRAYNIYPVDVHSGNLGFRIIDEDLIYFDVGNNENYEKVELKKIILN